MLDEPGKGSRETVLRRVGARREGSLTTDATTLALAHASPDAELLAVRQGVLQA